MYKYFISFTYHAWNGIVFKNTILELDHKINTMKDIEEVQAKINKQFNIIDVDKITSVNNFILLEGDK